MEEGNETGKLGRAGTIFKKRVRTDSVKGFLDYGLVGEENEGGGGVRQTDETTAPRVGKED